MKHKWWIASILLVAELALCAGIVVIANAAVVRTQQAGVYVRFFQFDAYPAEADDEQSFTVAAPANLMVANSTGQVTVQSGTGNSIIVHVHKKVWGSSPAEAQTALTTLKPVFVQNGNTVTVTSPTKPLEVVVFAASRPGPTFDLTITVPISTAVTVRNSFGSIALSGITGDVDVRTSNGPVHATDLLGNVNLRSTFGDVTAEHVTAGTFTAASTNGAVTLTDVTASGDLTVTDNFGAVLLNRGGAATLGVKTNNGDVTLTNLTLQGALTATSSFGSLTLNQVQAGSYDLHTNNGKILVDGASGTLQAKTDFGDVLVTHGSRVNLDLYSSNGSLAFSGSLGDGPHTVGTSFGSVRLSLPRDSALTVELKTNLGRLQSAFPLTQSGVVSNQHWSGTINGGGARLTASSNNGSIDLDILNP